MSCALEQVQIAVEQFGRSDTKHLLHGRCFTFSSVALDIGVSLRYIKCINSINTLLTFLIHFAQQEIANHAHLKFYKSNFSSAERKEERCDFY